MQRLIQDTIRKALADELLFGKLTKGGDVTVDFDGNEVVLGMGVAPAKAKRKTDKALVIAQEVRQKRLPGALFSCPDGVFATAGIRSLGL